MLYPWVTFILLLTCLRWSPLGAYCAFCDPEVIQRQQFYEDDLVVALYTHKPVLPGHCLVIPKRHVERFEGITDLEAARISQVIKRVDTAVTHVFGTASYLLLQKNGAEVGQTVPHVHFHYIPRKSGNGSTLEFMTRMYLADMHRPMSPEELQRVIIPLREAISTVTNIAESCPQPPLEAAEMVP